jgi:hypothetical protein
MSSHKSSRETICWLDVAVAAQRGAVAASIYPVDAVVDSPSFAVTIDNCWIAGGDGRLSVFETPQAARRFLELLGVRKVLWKGESKPLALPAQTNFQRFALSRDRLVEDNPASRQPSPLKGGVSGGAFRTGLEIPRHVGEGCPRARSQ